MFVDRSTLVFAQFLPHQAARVEQLFPAGAGIPVRQVGFGHAGLLVVDEFIGDAVFGQPVHGLLHGVAVLDAVELGHFGGGFMVLNGCWYCSSVSQFDPEEPDDI